LFLDFFHCVRGEAQFLFFVYHSPSTTLRKAFFNPPFYPYLIFKKNSSYFSLPYILHSSCISKFCRCLFLFLVFLCFFSLFLALFPIRFFLPFYFFVYLYQFTMATFVDHLLREFFFDLSLKKL
jgi:hypothetical protein